MKNGTPHFLNMSLILVSLFCIAVFIAQTACMNLMGEEAIRQLGVFYMSGITEQVSSHFGTIMELRLLQVEAIANAVPSSRTSGKTSLQIELAYNARSAGFEYLALFTEDGTFHMIYGSQVTPMVPEALYWSVQDGEDNVCAGRDASGTPIVLFGVPAIYPLDEGRESAALVAGLPADYLSATLENNIHSSILEYAVIRDDGSYVLGGGAEEETYFDQVERQYTFPNGKTPAQFVSALRRALVSDTDYTAEAMIDGKHWNIYCTKLPNSQWNLVLKISHSTLDETVNLLQQRWSYLSIGGCALIVGALLLVFLGYYRLTKVQLKKLDEARKTAEQAQLAAERSNKAKNEFLSNMSHDIRTPMNGIMGMTSIAIGSLDDPPRVRSCLKKIHISSRHLLGLITDMLDMSKIESGKLTLNMEPISLREIMHNIVTIIQPQAQEKNQQFNIYVHGICHEHLCSDRVRLSQILLNILGNAVKFTPDGGAIQLDLFEEPSPQGSGYIRSHLYIKDNGIGMSKEFQRKIFEAFSREDSARVEKVPGAGMGMAITKYIVDAMEGGISVESEQGVGSCFHITLDMELAAQKEKQLSLPGWHVLVADDDETARSLTVAALESIGLRGSGAADCEEALRMLEARQGQADAFQMLLVDHDIRGQDVLKYVRERFQGFGIPVVLLADGERDELEAQAEDCGVSGYVSKPLFRTELYYGLRPFIEVRSGPPQRKEPQGASLAGRRILIAEDNELNWEIASAILEELGLVVEWAENGQICVEKYEAAAPGWYDAILMDLRMPVMTGFEAAQALRASARKDAHSVPIIAVSADAFQEDIQKCLDCGMNAHTAKPFDREKVVALLNEYLNGVGAGAKEEL